MKLYHSQAPVQTILRFALLVALLVLLGVLIGRLLPSTTGTSDWIGYWSAARLLLEGKDPYNADEILRVQQETFLNRDFPMFTWNPPWLVALLLPLGALPFPQATVVWLLLNILLLGSVGLGSWWLFDRSTTGFRSWLALPIVFLYAQTITTLATGQITTLVPAGLVGFLIAYERERWFLAGVLLVLTTVKPHLLFLWLPLVFLWTLGEKRWQVWIGFTSGMAVLLALLTWFLPSWPEAYSAILNAPPIGWATPTLGGLVAATWGPAWVRYIGLLFVPLVIPLWWKVRSARLVDVTACLLPISLPLAVFGWSYDQILLLVPLIAIATWLVNREFSRRDTVLTTLVIAMFLIALVVQRLYGTNELYFFWVPLAVALIGAWSLWRRMAHVAQVHQELVPVS